MTDARELARIATADSTEQMGAGAFDREKTSRDVFDLPDDIDMTSADFRAVSSDQLGETRTLASGRTITLSARSGLRCANDLVNVSGHDVTIGTCSSTERREELRIVAAAATTTDGGEPRVLRIATSDSSVLLHSLPCYIDDFYLNGDFKRRRSSTVTVVMPPQGFARPLPRVVRDRCPGIVVTPEVGRYLERLYQELVIPAPCDADPLESVIPLAESSAPSLNERGEEQPLSRRRVGVFGVVTLASGEGQLIRYNALY